MTDSTEALKLERDTEAVARAICISQGEDPDSFNVMKICGAKNEPLPLWMYYSEHAEAAIATIAAPRPSVPGEASEPVQKLHELEAERVLREALNMMKIVATWLRNGDYDTRGGLIEMDRQATLMEGAIDKAEAALSTRSPTDRLEANACRDALLEAISDWKAPYEVAKIVNFTGHFSAISDALHKLVAEGLAKHHEGNNTFRAVRLEEKPALTLKKRGEDNA